MAITQRRILIVDDDRKLTDLIRLYLERDGYRVLAAYDGQTALDHFRDWRPALVVLDLMLPRLSGLEVCRLIRAESNVPIIMLTARSTEEDTLLGLELGADDYITKPFSPRELVARIRVVLRRIQSDEDAGAKDLVAGPIALSPLRHEVTLDGRHVDLTPTEFRLLAALMAEPGRAFTRLQLLDKALGTEFEGFERNIDVHVMNLRRKLKMSADGPIRTVYGVGYKFETPVHA